MMETERLVEIGEDDERVRDYVEIGRDFRIEIEISLAISQFPSLVFPISKSPLPQSPNLQP
jgi:hypothetical protein